MVLSLTYRRPAHVSSSRDSLTGDEKQKSINESIKSGSSSSTLGIPDALSFDRILSGGACPPCTVRDFMNYLKYIEHSAENLQFFLWYRGYLERFNNLSESERALSPPWTAAQAESESPPNTSSRRKRHDSVIVSALQGTDFAEKAPHSGERHDPFRDGDVHSSSEGERQELGASSFGSSQGDSDSSAYAAKAEEAYENAGLQWKPFTAQPFRQEVNRVIAIYIAVDSPRQLNLSSRERVSVLHALQNTTHPSAFHAVLATVEHSLRRQAHPNFIRWTICNGNRPRVIFARGLGISGILAGFLTCLLITLSSAGRGWRCLGLIGFLIGISTLIAAWKGMCVVLHGMHHRHLRPWELFLDDGELDAMQEKTTSQESLVSNHSNSYEDEPWIPRYEKRNVVRKIFDREVWIQEPALRQIQDTIFLQSVLGAFVASIIIVGIFCAVPHGNFY